MNGQEDLSVDVLDIANGEWRSLDPVRKPRTSGGWKQVAVEGRIEIPDTKAKQQLVERSIEEYRRPVEIIDVKIISDRGEGSHIRESDKFRIRVGLKFNEVVDTTNVSINIFRLDGVYVFYQASCLERVIYAYDRVDFVEFSFDSNPFGAGEYEVNAFATNAFTLDQAPPTEIYDKYIGHRLTIALSRPIEFGLINMTVPVTLIGSSALAEPEVD